MSENYLCPICKTPMGVEQGTIINRLDGVTMGCSKPMAECTCTATGHGRNEKEAYSVIVQKCNKSLNKE